MIVELLISGVSYFIFDYIEKREFNEYKKVFDSIIERLPELKNNKNETLNLNSYELTDYGYKIKFYLPVGITTETIQSNFLKLKQAFKLNSMHFVEDERLITLYAIKEYDFKGFKPLKLEPHEIYLGEFINKKIVVDMNKFPHCLIGGDSGTGKSRLLFTILTNLISNSNRIELHLLQVRKNDLIVFQKCKQVKTCSRSLEQVLESLRLIDMELQRRESLLDIEKGYLNIADYNRLSGKTLKYIYVVIEEFSFLNISRADSKEEKLMKAECLKLIKSIVNIGRSSGVFLITSLQKPTNDSIPSDIKAQLTTRISMLIKDKPTSIVVLGDDSATNLGEREFVCRTKETIKGYSLTIDFPEITEYTKNSIVVKEQKANPPYKDKIQNTANDILNALGL
ncbi:MAG TPA: cell division protein FtsK [Clostridiales bacterium]|nr:cell division protein FtsK [Clostridiales bacterium]